MLKTLRAQMFETVSSRRGSAALEIKASPHFMRWLQEQRLSLAVSTYQIGKLMLLGTNAQGQLSVFERTFGQCMGMATTANGFWLASQFQIWRFENALPPGILHQDHDRLYVPQVGYTTGQIDTHDLGVTADGQVLFVNTQFNCIATLSNTHSFRPVWQPPFITSLAPGDRCHLNGLAIRDGHLAYVTATGHGNDVDSWRAHRDTGGVLIDTASREIIASGLSMPHSPRWHDDHLWLCNAGTGEFGFVDLRSGRFEAIAFCPGYLRGLAFHGDFAVVGLSRPRSHALHGLPLENQLNAHRAEPRCGLHVIDLRRGDTAHWLHFDGLVDELYDVVTLPGVKRPMALGFVTEDIQRTITIDA